VYAEKLGLRPSLSLIVDFSEKTTQRRGERGKKEEDKYQIREGFSTTKGQAWSKTREGLKQCTIWSWDKGGKSLRHLRQGVNVSWRNSLKNSNGKTGLARKGERRCEGGRAIKPKSKGGVQDGSQRAIKT